MHLKFVTFKAHSVVVAIFETNAVSGYCWITVFVDLHNPALGC